MLSHEDQRGYWLDPMERVWRPRATDSGSGAAVTGATAYAAFVGRVPAPRIIKYVRIRVTSAGSSTQTAEIGTFFSNGPPVRGVSPVLYPFETTGTLDALTGTGDKANTTAFKKMLYTGMWLWYVIRVDMAGTEPSLRDFENNDLSTGYLCTLAGASALTGVASLTMTLALGPVVPLMWGTMD